MSNYKDVEELVSFVADLANGIGKALEDKKFTIGDLPDFIPALKSAYAAIENVQDVWNQFKNMTRDEQSALAEVFAQRFDIPQDKAEEVVEKAVRIGLQLYELIKSLK